MGVKQNRPGQNRNKSSLTLALKAKQNPLFIIGLCMAPFFIQVDQGKGKDMALTKAELTTSFQLEDSLDLDKKIEEITKNASSYFRD